LVWLFSLLIFSFRKITSQTTNIVVVAMKDITQKTEPREEVILVETKEKFTGLS